MIAFVEIMQIYNGSNGDATKALYERLGKLGAVGEVAVNLFRAHKSSSRAKVYRGGGYRGKAYDKKQWSLDNVAALLERDAAALNLVWGWKEDPKQSLHKWVLYCELPAGQVSFHSAERGIGPDYPGEWDQTLEQGPTRICRWVTRLLEERSAA